MNETHNFKIIVLGSKFLKYLFLDNLLRFSGGCNEENECNAYKFDICIILNDKFVI